MAFKEKFMKTLATIVAVMAACFILNCFIMMPPPVEILKWMIPNLPAVTADAGKGPFLVIASMVGTTVFAGLFIIRTTLVKEAGWGLEHFKHQRNDAIVSVLVISLLGLVVPIFEARPVFVMIISQAFNSTILPLTVGCILYLGNRKDLMGEHKKKSVIILSSLRFSCFPSSPPSWG